MQPRNIACLISVGIQVCSLAKPTIMSIWRPGESLLVLHNAKIKTAGSDRDLRAAQAPVVGDLGSKGRIIVFSYGAESSGIQQSPGPGGAGLR